MNPSDLKRRLEVDGFLVLPNFLQKASLVEVLPLRSSRRVMRRLRGIRTRRSRGIERRFAPCISGFRCKTWMSRTGACTSSLEVTGQAC